MNFRLTILYIVSLVYASHSVAADLDSKWWTRKDWTVFNFECPAGLKKFQDEDKGILACKKGDKYHGPFMTFTGQGFVSAVATMDSGVQVGDYVTYFDGVHGTKGRVQSQAIFEKGKANGFAQEFYQNGKIKKKIGYSVGVMNGPAWVYDEDGSLSAEGKNVNGKAVGPWKMKNSDGTYTTVIYESGVPKAPDWPKVSEEKSKQLVAFLDKGVPIKRDAKSIAEMGRLCFETAKFYYKNGSNLPSLDGLSWDALAEEVSLMSSCALIPRKPFPNYCLKKDGCAGVVRFINEYEVLQKVDDSVYSASGYGTVILPGQPGRRIVDGDVLTFYSTEKPSEGTNRLILTKAGSRKFLKKNGFNEEFPYYYQINQVGLAKILCRLKAIGDHVEKLKRYRCGYYTKGSYLDASSIQLYCVPYFQYDNEGSDRNGSDMEIQPVDVDCKN